MPIAAQKPAMEKEKGENHLSFIFQNSCQNQEIW
jgi:hypothetical protein